MLIRRPRRYVLIIVVTIVLCSVILMVGRHYYHYTSTNAFCATCHEMVESYNQWKSSTHYDGKSGVVVNCVDCHLPPSGLKKFFAKVYFGLSDQYAHYFKDVENINWEAKKREVGRYTFEENCKRCHANLFPSGLTSGGIKAHREYVDKLTDKKCFDCHEHQNLVHK